MGSGPYEKRKFVLLLSRHPTPLGYVCDYTASKVFLTSYLKFRISQNNTICKRIVLDFLKQKHTRF